MKFTKMHGCGNDYVYVNLFEETITDPEKLAIVDILPLTLEEIFIFFLGGLDYEVKDILF